MAKTNTGTEGSHSPAQPPGPPGTEQAHSVAYDENRDTEARRDDPAPAEVHPTVVAKTRHDKFGGFHGGAAFFGWLVAVALTVLLTGIVGAIATAVGSSLTVTQDEAERQAGTIGLSSAIALVTILVVSYFAGGYVAGRMARYDGGRQGLGVWGLGVIVTGIVVMLGVVFGAQYDIFQRVTVPSIPVPTDTLATGSLVTFGAVLVGTLIAALLGGVAGRRYHRKIDRFGT